MSTLSLEKCTVITALFTALMVCFAAAATAQTGDDIFETDRDGKSYVCGKVGGTWLSGQRTRGVFTSYARLLEKNIESLNALRRSEQGRAPSRQKREKLESEGKKYRLGIKSTSFCQEAALEAAATTDPNFDSVGNITEIGRITLGIPENLSANISAGSEAYQRECQRCHSAEKSGKTYAELAAALPRPPMNLTIAPEVIANLTAYLNRQ